MPDPQPIQPSVVEPVGGGPSGDREAPQKTAASPVDGPTAPDGDAVGPSQPAVEVAADDDSQDVDTRTESVAERGPQTAKEPLPDEPKQTDPQANSTVDSPTPSDVEPTEEADRPEPEPVRFAADADALLVVEGADEGWRRLAAGAELPPGARVVSLPTYRGTLDLGSGVTCELVGLTDATIAAPEDTPGVELRYGRIALRHTASGEGARSTTVRVLLDGVEHRVTLEPGTTLAVQADRPFRPGGELFTGAGVALVAEARLIEGAIVWEAAGERLELKQPRVLPIVGDADLGPFTWVEGLALSAEESLASPTLADDLTPEAPLVKQLETIHARDAFREVRDLAARCLLALGSPGLVVARLGDEQQSRLWAPTVTELRAAASRSPADATRVRLALVVEFGEAAASELTRLLRGFGAAEVGRDAEGVASGAVPEQIVPALQSRDLATRVVASVALDQAVGTLNRPYNPGDSLGKRNGAVRALQKQLEEASLPPVAGAR